MCLGRVASLHLPVARSDSQRASVLEGSAERFLCVAAGVWRGRDRDADPAQCLPEPLCATT